MVRGDRAARGRRGGGRGGGPKAEGDRERAPLNQPCRQWQKDRTCPYEPNCRYSHGNSSNHTQGKNPHQKSEETAEQREAKENYNTWKRLIKTNPKPNDTKTMDKLWTDALNILDGENRDWKQMLPRDLDDQNLKGREHIGALLSMLAGPNGHGIFVKLAHAFLAAITHSALLDCLSVDTAVGGLYNYISGNCGRRMIPFLQRLHVCLVEEYLNPTLLESKATIETSLTAMTTALRELLKREPRAAFNDDLPNFIESIAANLAATGVEESTVTHHRVHCGLRELQGIVARAQGLLQEEQQQPSAGGVTTSVVLSTYPRELDMPRDRHDNDKADITQIQILPTEEEIRSDHAPFLPSTDPNQPHFLTNSVERHLDTHFRLYRHDCLGEVSEAIGGAIHAIENDPDILENTKYSLGNIRAYTYPKTRVQYVAYDHRRGLEAQLTFLQPPEVRKGASSAKLKSWWEDSRRLDEGRLLCLLFLDSGKASILLLTVTEKCTDQKKLTSLTHNTRHATITAKLATGLETDLEKLVNLNGHDRSGLLVEFPNVLLVTFLPILENLQNMQRQSRMPFHQWISPQHTPSTGNTTKVLIIPPPLYARDSKFAFSLKPLLRNPSHQLTIRPLSIADIPVDLDMLEKETCLDRGQCEALVAALSREYAFIQGPPGTGKSFLGVQVMRVLQECNSQTGLGPVIVICYTNHALDQFLEHLVEVGIEKVIRLGGQSRSEALKGKNLRIVAKGESRTRSEGYQIAMGYRALEEKEEVIKKILGTLHKVQQPPRWSTLQHFLSHSYTTIHRQFSRVDEEGFESVGRDPFDIWLAQKAPAQPAQRPVPIDNLLNTARSNVYSVLPAHRRQLVDYWIEEIRAAATDDLFESVKEANTLQRNLTAVHDDVDRRVLQTADVIGVTTTGLAKRIATLRHVKCKVVICEEAGEVLEPHLLSALLPSVEHFIQIGDHQQLRPQINNYKLSLESQQGSLYQLDRSQFERLASANDPNARVPIAQLNVQRRMRPEISSLIRQTIYSRLRDHESTKNLPDVVGMRHNVFWLNHDHLQDVAQANSHARSHSNIWEVEMVHALVRHVVRQGVYNSSDIAVLTPYTGQLQKLRHKMRNDFEIVLSDRDQETLWRDGFEDLESGPQGTNTQSRSASGPAPLAKKQMSELLRMATVDNFQGEEAKVVIVSLVRSNKEKKVGFLRTTNRINVLLSRAQRGMYLLGNAETYSSQPMWAQVLAMLEAKGAVGESLGLCCPRHTDTEIQVSQPEDFARLSPEGGCQLAAVINAPEPAASARILTWTINGKSNTLLVRRSVDDGLEPATTPVRGLVTVIRDAGHVPHYVRFGVPTLDAPSDATSHAHRVWKNVLGLVSMRATAECLVVHHVIACRAIIAAQRYYPAGTNALGFAICSDKLEARVDLLEMKTYREIDLDENPIVALPCGHFFTAETLDGHLQMASVYMQNLHGEYTALQDISNKLAEAIPRCPDCQCPIRQHSTHRYNRMINRAVMDEMSKRFLVSGKDKLRGLQHDIAGLEDGFEELDNTIKTIPGPSSLQNLASETVKKTTNIKKLCSQRHAAVSKVKAAINSFCREVSDKNQPAKKLHDAQLSALRQRSVVCVFKDLSINEIVPSIPRDQRVTMGGSALSLHIDCILLVDSLTFNQRLKSTLGKSDIQDFKDPGVLAGPSPIQFFNDCSSFVEQCQTENLPKYSVEAALFYARVARAFQGYSHSLETQIEEASRHVKTAKALLEKASDLCTQAFENAANLRRAVEESLKQLGKEWYEPVTTEEIETIKKAMVSGRTGIATHSGHWYNCANGHPAGHAQHIPQQDTRKLSVKGIAERMKIEKIKKVNLRCSRSCMVAKVQASIRARDNGRLLAALALGRRGSTIASAALMSQRVDHIQHDTRNLSSHLSILAMAPEDQPATCPDQRNKKDCWWFDTLIRTLRNSRPKVEITTKKKRIEGYPDRPKEEEMTPKELHFIDEQAKYVGFAADEPCDRTKQERYDGEY
ncbi:MAG: hypothetical protein Q9218_005433 [Villophora microphyllina]